MTLHTLHKGNLIAGSLAAAIESLIRDRAEKTELPFALVIGALEIVKHILLQEQLSA